MIRPAVVIAVWLMGATAAWAQVGLVWNGRTVDEAAALHRAGVREILVETLLPEAVVDTLAALGIGITADPGHRYLLADDSVRTDDLAQAYASYPWYRGAVAATDPSPDWTPPTAAIVAHTRAGVVHAPGLLTRFRQWDVARITDSLRSGGTTVFLPAEWLDGPHAETVRAWLADASHLPEWPARAAAAPASGPGPAMLVVLAAFWLLMYRGMPLYRKMAGRYVSTHGFFVADVMQRRARLAPSTLALWVLFALLSGLFLAEGLHLLFSPHGLHYLGSMGWPDSWWGWFGLGTGLSLLWDMALALWLFAAGTRRALVDQALTLLLWPRHLQVPVVLLVVVAHSGSPLAAALPAALVLFPLIWVAALPIAATDMASHLGAGAWRFRLLTLVPYLMLTGAVLVLTDAGGAAFEPVRLALALR